MMGNMHSPKQPYFVLPTVHPVKHKINRKNQPNPIEPLVFEAEIAMLIAKCEHQKIKSPESHINAGIGNHQHYILKSIFPGIPLPVLNMTDQNFGTNKQ